jgi:MFS family permease
MPAVLRHRDFRLLFAAQAASTLGDAVVVVALALYVTGRTRSAGDLGIILAAKSLPFVGLLLLGGVLADRLPRRRIIVFADSTRGALHALLALLIALGRPAVWQIATIEALYGVAQAFYQPALTGLAPATTPEDEIGSGRALMESVQNLGNLIGPLVATALVLGLGAWEAFALDALTFALSVGLTARIHGRSRGEAGGEPDSLLAELRGGFHEVRSRRWVWATISVFSLVLLALLAQWDALAPGVARDRYGSAAVFGFVESALGVGALAGALTALRWRPRRPLRTGFPMMVFWPLTALLFAVHAPVVAVCACGVAAGVAFALFVIWWETALAGHIPPRALSRVSAWDWMGSLGLMPIGYAVAGPLASALGPRGVLAAGSLLAIGLLGLGFAPRETRELPYPSSSVARSA